MGKLYDLVEFRNELVQQLDSLRVDTVIHSRIDLLKKIKRKFPDQAEYVNRKIIEYLTLVDQSTRIIAEFDEKFSELNQEIDNTAISMFNNDDYYNAFQEKNIQGPHFQELIVTDNISSHLESKITQYSNWHYPALQINPRRKKWIDSMVAGDPLYLTHFDINLVRELIQTYPSLYQSRLRLYEINEGNFSVLPQAQFGFVLCWDNFNYFSLIEIEKYIREVWKLLRPGGHFIFSYSNCDLEGPALRAENWACGYSNLRWLTKLLKEIGYEITALHDDETGDAFNTHTSWADIKKPGDLKTVKAAQAMGQILSK
jgi:SAM-dependent methyltransferase